MGGGNGSVSKALEQHGLDTVVLEPGPDGAQNARRRGLRNVVCATLEEARFAAEAFGAIGLFDVVEHLADDAAILREARRVLRPGGALCITVPAYRWLWSAQDELAGHHRRYTLRGLRALLGRSGYAVRFATYCFAPLTVPVLLARSLPYRLFGRRTREIEDSAVQQHVPSPLARRAMDGLLALELAQIQRGHVVPFGTSCLAVAVKTADPPA